jgi:hypothetical protein
MNGCFRYMHDGFDERIYANGVRHARPRKNVYSGCFEELTSFIVVMLAGPCRVVMLSAPCERNCSSVGMG